MDKEEHEGKREHQPNDRFHQITSNDEKPHIGTHGWGFDSGRFRVVIYAPNEVDTLVAREDKAEAQDSRKNKAKNPQKHIEGDGYKERVRDQVAGKKGKSRQKKPYQSDHPPAHVHVYDMDSKKIRENKYELIDSADGCHTAIIIEPIVGEDGSYSKRGEKKLKIAIKEQHDEAIQGILDNSAKDFIALWRKLYSPEIHNQKVREGNKAFRNRYDMHITERVEIPNGEALRRRETSDSVSYTREADNLKLRVKYLPNDHDPQGISR